MNFNNLMCRCGCMDEWKLSWGYTDIWKLTINCNSCGAVHHIAQSNNEDVKVRDIVSSDTK